MPADSFRPGRGLPPRSPPPHPFPARGRGEERIARRESEEGPAAPTAKGPGAPSAPGRIGESRLIDSERDRGDGSRVRGAPPPGPGRPGARDVMTTGSASRAPHGAARGVFPKVERMAGWDNEFETDRDRDRGRYEPRARRARRPSPAAGAPARPRASVAETPGRRRRAATVAIARRGAGRARGKGKGKGKGRDKGTATATAAPRARARPRARRRPGLMARGPAGRGPRGGRRRSPASSARGSARAASRTSPRTAWRSPRRAPARSWRGSRGRPSTASGSGSAARSWWRRAVARISPRSATRVNTSGRRSSPPTRGACCPGRRCRRARSAW